MTERDLFRSVVAGSRTTRGIADALVARPDKIVVRRRWGLVAAVNAVDSTIDVTVDGVTIPHVRRSAYYTPTVGELVWLDVVDTDVVAVSPIAPSPANDYVPRSSISDGPTFGTFVAYAKNATAFTFNTSTLTENTQLRTVGSVPVGYVVKVSLSFFMNYGGGSDAFDANLAEFDVRANGTSIRSHDIQWRAQAIGGSGQETFSTWVAAALPTVSTTFTVWAKRELGARTFSMLAGSEMIVELLAPVNTTKLIVLTDA